MVRNLLTFALFMGSLLQAAPHMIHAKLWDSRFELGHTEMKSVLVGDSGQWHSVRTIWVDAEASGSGANLAVYANGERLAVIKVPGKKDPFAVTINETTRSIEFHNEGPNRVFVHSVEVDRSNEPVSEYQPTEPLPVFLPIESTYKDLEIPEAHKATNRRIFWLSTHMVSEVERLRDAVDLESEFSPYLIPIVRKSGRLAAISKALPDYSDSVIQASKVLIQQLKFADRLFDEYLERPEFRERVLRVLYLSYSLSLTVRQIELEKE